MFVTSCSYSQLLGLYKPLMIGGPCISDKSSPKLADIAKMMTPSYPTNYKTYCPLSFNAVYQRRLFTGGSIGNSMPIQVPLISPFWVGNHFPFFRVWPFFADYPYRSISKMGFSKVILGHLKTDIPRRHPHGICILSWQPFCILVRQPQNQMAIRSM